MELEKKQSEIIDHYTKQAAGMEQGSSLVILITEATSHPLLFAFSEILSVSNVSKLEGTQYSSYLDLLRLFAYGTCTDYKNNASHLPTLSSDQIHKLKQLTVLTLAESSKVLPYDKLMQELDVSNVRELEDFLINDCMYVGIVRGKLDQLRRCFEVQFAAGRDLKPEQFNSMLQTLEDCCTCWSCFTVPYKCFTTLVQVVNNCNSQVLQTVEHFREFTSFHPRKNKVGRRNERSGPETPKRSRREEGRCKENLYQVQFFRPEANQVEMGYRGHDETFYADLGGSGLMDFEPESARPKRRRHPHR